MGKTGINVKIPNREYALGIVDGFSRNEVYLKDLINECVPNTSGARVDSMDYSELLHYGNVIRGVADKIVKPSKERGEPERLEDTVSSEEEQLTFLAELER